MPNASLDIVAARFERIVGFLCGHAGPDTPKSGKIAAKVINHYGDEVLKVYPISN